MSAIAKKTQSISPYKKKNKLKPKSVEDLSKLVTLCDKLIETYDTRLIDDMPDELAFAFYKTEAEKCLNNIYKYHPKNLYTDYILDQSGQRIDETTMHYLGNYLSTQVYKLNDVVSYLGGRWMAIHGMTIGNTPAVGSAYWSHISEQSNHISGQFSVLVRLFDNYFRHRYPTQLKPVTRFIKGPKNLTVHWSERFNMHVYIFGEHHIPGDCAKYPLSTVLNTVNIENYLDKLLQNTHRYLDYLFEVPMIGKKRLQYTSDDPSGDPSGDITIYTNSHLDNIFQKFRVCIEPVTRHAARCGLGRVHFMDVRYENTTYTDTISFLWMHFVSNYSNKRYIINILNNKFFFKRLKDMYSFGCSTQNKLFIYFKSFIFGNIYNVVELNKLLESQNSIDIEVGNRIKNYIEYEIRALVQKFFLPLTTNIADILYTWKQIVGKKYKHWAFIPSSQIQQIIESFRYVARCLTRLVSIGPDLYLLSRMFKTFNVDKLPFVNAYRHDQPKKMHNIVTYTGDAHAQRYRRFLQSFGFIEVEKTGQSDDDPISCIDMIDIQQPFFSQTFNSKKFNIPPAKMYNYNFNYSHTYDEF